MLSKQLQDQIEQEAKAGQHTHPGTDYGHGFNKGYDSGYKFAAEKYAALYETALARAERAERALQQIRKWELPNTGKFWDIEKTQPMSYEACYGSNGARDYFRNLANHVLNGTTESLTPKTGEDE